MALGGGVGGSCWGLFCRAQLRFWGRGCIGSIAGLRVLGHCGWFQHGSGAAKVLGVVGDRDCLGFGASLVSLLGMSGVEQTFGIMGVLQFPGASEDPFWGMEGLRVAIAALCRA